MMVTSDREEPTRSQANPASARFSGLTLDSRPQGLIGSTTSQQLGSIMTHKQITFQLKESYGRTRAYPVSPEAKLLVDLTGAKTLLPQAMPTLVGLGYQCVDQQGQAINPSQLY